MATNLTPDQMKQFVRNHFEDFVNNRNAAVIHKNMTPNFYDHDGPGGKPTDAKGDEQMMIGMYKVMPDLHLTIEEMLAEGNKVVCRNTWRWTDSSGKKMEFHGFVMWRFEGGKIGERWATVTQPSEGASRSVTSTHKQLANNELVWHTNMGMPTRSNSELIEAYLDAVMRKDTSVIERFFAQDVEYLVNGTLTQNA